MVLLIPLNALASNRVALVIGNASYIDMPLSNPRNDAVAMQSALQQAGFDVVSALDADLASMQTAMLNFVEKLNDNSTALVFYAGHGVQANGRNYLLPVDAKIESERSLRFQALELGDLLEELEASDARIKIVILDACRNNPFERSMRGGGRGLAAVDAARGTLIAYATSPGSTASDGDGDNGLYTQSLLQAILQPGVKVEQVFKQVRIAVAEASRGSQIPWESSSLTGDFVFIETTDAAKPTTTAAASAQSSAAPAAKSAEQRAVDHEALFWESVRDSDDAKLLQAYIDQYPKGHYAFIAKLKIDKLQAKVAPPAIDHTPAPIESKSPVADVAVMVDAAAVGNKGQCGDLSGRWSNHSSNPGLCVPKEFVLTSINKNTYQMLGSGCGVALTATADYQDDLTLVSHWKMSTCTGTSTYQLNDDCSVGKGIVEVNRSLLCHVKDTKETISKIP